MSFAEQERALFDLLFDYGLREQFCVKAADALADYALEETELNDFNEIRPDGLKLDAAMRIYQILGQFCRQFPVTFSLVSSLGNGVGLLQKLVNLNTMRCPPVERSFAFGSQLQEELRQQSSVTRFQSVAEQAMVNAILGAELAMASTGATLKQQLLLGELPPESFADDVNGWQNKPIKLAPYVGAVIIPQPYSALKNSLCPDGGNGLWAQLSRSPVSVSLVSQTLENETPTLLITRAYVGKFARCEPRVDHKTVELNDGFAPLLQQINGANSTAQIMEEFQQAGATKQILDAVQAGFQQLIKSGVVGFA